MNRLFWKIGSLSWHPYVPTLPPDCGVVPSLPVGSSLQVVFLHLVAISAVIASLPLALLNRAKMPSDISPAHDSGLIKPGNQAPFLFYVILISEVAHGSVFSSAGHTLSHRLLQ